VPDTQHAAKSIGDMMPWHAARRSVSRSQGPLRSTAGMPAPRSSRVGNVSHSRRAPVAAAIRVAARSTYYAQAGLFNGRAGMILYLAGQDRHEPQDPQEPQDPHAAAHIRRLAWHAMPYADGLAFPGDQLLRLSMDLGTGTAGILLALAAALAPRGAALPFLGPPKSLPGQTPQGFVRERVNVRR